MRCFDLATEARIPGVPSIEADGRGLFAGWLDADYPVPVSLVKPPETRDCSCHAVPRGQF
jgi:hypothetical protein